jgi:enterochelin esterase-like enzyme
MSFARADQPGRSSAVLVCLSLIACHQSESRSAPSVAPEPVSVVITKVSASSGPVAEPTPVQPAAFASGGYREITWQLQGPFGEQPVVVVVPNSANQQQRLPVLVVFHGRGEALKAPGRGARGFLDDYGLLQALQHLEEPPLSRADFGGFIEPAHLQIINDSLRRHPYQGLIVVCPYLPDILRAENFSPEGKQLAHFIASTVLPKVYAETPSLSGPEHTAVDGISLGGRAAWATAVFEPKAFSVAAATQPAFDEKELGVLAALAAQARQQNPALRLRLLTSDQDYFLQTTVSLSKGLRTIRVEHELDQVMGNHSYEFNRGPGVHEMLLFADRALRSSSTR